MPDYQAPPEKLPPGKTYAIDFDTKTGAGLIRYVKITIEEDLMDMEDRVRIDLCDHPLYPRLAEYVRSHPAR